MRGVCQRLQSLVPTRPAVRRVLPAPVRRRNHGAAPGLTGRWRGATWSVRMTTVTKLAATQFKATCLEVLERVRRTGERVVITRRGKAIAQLLPLTSEGDEAPQKRLLGTVEIVGDILSPAVPRSAWKAMAARPPRRHGSKA